MANIASAAVGPDIDAHVAAPPTTTTTKMALRRAMAITSDFGTPASSAPTTGQLWPRGS
jgi:hypothetical protein